MFLAKLFETHIIPKDLFPNTLYVYVLRFMFEIIKIFKFSLKNGIHSKKEILNPTLLKFMF